jgi:hypothetical protein
MTASLLKNFNSMASLMPFLRASLHQTMIRKLANVGKDKDGWKKTDEHLTALMDQEHMITLGDTDAAVKQCQKYLERAVTDDASVPAEAARSRSRSRMCKRGKEETELDFIQAHL